MFVAKVVLYVYYQVYQASSSTRSAPGGVKETKKSVVDTRTGTKKMAIGHHIGERAHIMEREQNTNTGEIEGRDNLINLDLGKLSAQAYPKSPNASKVTQVCSSHR